MTSVLAAVSGPIVIGTWNGVLDAQLQANSPVQFQPTPAATEQYGLSRAECIPSVDQGTYTILDELVAGQIEDFAVSLRMAELFAADQAARQLPVGIDPQKMSEEDAQRRIEVLNYIANGQIRSARNLVYAAYIFQHGNCPEHYRLGNRLAQIAMDTGYSDARWIYAATLDRYLMSLGEFQKYGTQYTWIDGEFKLYPVDPTTTDEERARYNVPPLNEAINRAMVGMGGGVVRGRWWGTWWLTLIGAGFSVLSAIIGVVDAKKNAPLGRVVLVIAFALYLISAAGHYAQINALRQGTAELQGNIWNIVNGLMIMLWLACAGIEIVRVLKSKSAQPPH